jgi:hypothetical protein
MTESRSTATFTVAIRTARFTSIRDVQLPGTNVARWVERVRSKFA